MFIALVAPFLILTLLLSDTYYRWRFSSGHNLPRGPHPFPFLGNIWTYGELCLLWYGYKPVLIVSGARAAHEILHKSSMYSSSRFDHNNFRRVVGRGRLVLTPEGPEFRMIRKMYHTILSPQQSKVFMEYQDFESKQLLLDLSGGPDNFMRAFERYAVSVLCSGTYGIRLRTLSHSIIVDLYHIWDQIMLYFQPGTLPIDFIPTITKLPAWLQPWNSLAEELIGQENDIQLSLLRNMPSQKSADGNQKLFGHTLLEWQKAEGFDDQLAGQILAMLVGAGSATTSSMLQNFFKVVALHPDKIARAHAELDRVVGQDRLPSWEDEYQLPYIRALIKEVHRLWPSAELGVSHLLTADITYDQAVIPKGAVIFPNLVGLARDPQRYEDGKLFLPERFLNDELDASASALSSDWMQRDHFHYGFGRRLCQGVIVAENSLYIAISRVLWAFDIQQAPGAHLNMTERFDGFIRKPEPYRLVIRTRGLRYQAAIQEAMREGCSSVPDLEDLSSR